VTPAEHLAAARRGLIAAVERYARMVEPLPAIDVPIPGSAWTVRDATVHLAGSHHRHLGYVSGDTLPAATLDKELLDARTRAQIAENAEADPKMLAEQIRDGFAELLAVTAPVPADRPIAYHGGLTSNLADLSCVLLGEYLLHGYDVATALRLPWPIDPEQAALVVAAYRMAYRLTFQPAAAAGLRARYRLEIPGTAPFHVTVADGAYEEPARPPSIDCVIAADPVTALLVQSGRLSQWPAVALGRLTYAGPHPELGPRFAELFVFP
jgi:uncharacterized protein (TIGR03083 family)